MGAKRNPKRRQLQQFLAERQAAAVDDALRDEIARALAPVSEDYLRDLLRECGLPLSPLVEGVRQDSLESLRRTLTALAGEYLRYPVRTRALVIRAKDHAKLAALRTAPALRQEKREMVGWMMVWLEDPAMFETWSGMRLERLTAARSTGP